MPSTVGPQPSQQPFRADRPPTAVEPVHNGGATDTSGWFGNGSNKAPPLTISTTTADAEAPASTPGTTAADANATALTIQFPRRPGQGTHGRVIPVRANFFEFLTLPGQNIYHYDVRIMPEVPPSLNRKIFHQMEEQFGKSKLDSAIVVFDGYVVVVVMVVLDVILLP